MGSTTWTNDQLRNYNAKIRRERFNDQSPVVHQSEKEKDLQESIIDYARGKGWWVDYSRMDLPTTRPLGAPDIYVFADGGRLFIVEAKAKTGKLTSAQLGVKIALGHLGHTVHVVRSIKEFIQLVTYGPSQT